MFYYNQFAKQTYVLQGGKMMKKNKVIKINLKKFIRALVIVIGITILITFLATKSIYSYEKLKTKTIYTNKGDTLWNIALDEKENNKYYKDKNIREIVYDIKQINNMQDSIILPGEALKIYYK